MPVMLAVLSVQQATGLTATRVREENPPEHAGDEPARMATIFAPPAVRPGLPQGMAGAFNAAVAARLSRGLMVKVTFTLAFSQRAKLFHHKGQLLREQLVPTPVRQLRKK